MICVSAATPGIAIAVRVGQARRGGADHQRLRHRVQRRRFEAIAQPATRSYSAEPAAAASAAAAKPAMPGRFSVPARRPRSCPPPRSSGVELGAADHDERADPRRAAELVRRQADQIGADRGGIERRSCRPPAPRRSGTARRARARSRRSRATGCTIAGLVVREHHRDQRRARIGREHRVERVEIDDAVRVDRDALGLGHGLQDRTVLDGGNENAVAAGSRAARGGWPRCRR